MVLKAQDGKNNNFKLIFHKNNERNRRGGEHFIGLSCNSNKIFLGGGKNWTNFSRNRFLRDATTFTMNTKIAFHMVTTRHCHFSQYLTNSEIFSPTKKNLNSMLVCSKSNTQQQELKHGHQHQHHHRGEWLVGGGGTDGGWGCGLRPPAPLRFPPGGTQPHTATCRWPRRKKLQ